VKAKLLIERGDYLLWTIENVARQSELNSIVIDVHNNKIFSTNSVGEGKAFLLTTIEYYLNAQLLEILHNK
jgi:hypothetical protein